MPLDLPAGSLSFIDTNVLVYHFVDNSPYGAVCREFLGRVVAGELFAVSTSAVMADAVHKVMAEEARFQLTLESGVVRFLQHHPAEIARLSAFVAAARQLEQLPIRLLTVDTSLIRLAAELARAHGLLMNDAIIVSVMQDQGIENLVTNDDDFDPVPGIKVWKPRL